MTAGEIQQLVNDLLEQLWSILRSPSLPRWLREKPPVELPGWNSEADSSRFSFFLARARGSWRRRPKECKELNRIRRNANVLV